MSTAKHYGNVRTKHNTKEQTSNELTFFGIFHRKLTTLPYDLISLKKI
jgi:hypothetical protein